MLTFSRLLARRQGRGGLLRSKWTSSAPASAFYSRKLNGSAAAGASAVDHPAHEKSTPSITAPRIRRIGYGTRTKMKPRLRFLDPDGKENMVDSLWLRDHCQCAQCVNQITMQRAFDTFSLPPDDPGEVVENGDALQVKWRDGHVSTYQWDWIARTLRSAKQIPEDNGMPLVKVLFDSEIEADPPSVDYEEIMASDAGVATWTRKIQEFGFCYVNECPVSPEKTEQLLKRIANIRVTHYGGFYDFTSDLSLKDTAYTNQALAAHTDNAYFSEPSRLQMFHLLSHTDGEGGASLLVDGYKCIKILQKVSWEAYEELRQVPIRWHASGNDGIIISSGATVPIIGKFASPVRDIRLLRWNNDDRATLRGPNFSKSSSLDNWYDAARLFDTIIKDKRNEYWSQLKPGRPLIFDNWRVLHGRSAFTGKRRICGGYICGDDFTSRYLNTNFPRETVLQMYL